MSVVHESYVSKLGEKSIFGQRSWLPRYLVLFEDKLIYCKKPNEKDSPKTKAIMPFVGRNVLIEEMPPDALKTGSFS
jgi:hypothetical protein